MDLAKPRTTVWGLFSNRTKNNVCLIAETALYFMEIGRQAAVRANA
jgi:hypothetical protein